MSPAGGAWSPSSWRTTGGSRQKPGPPRWQTCPCRPVTSTGTSSSRHWPSTSRPATAAAPRPRRHPGRLLPPPRPARPRGVVADVCMIGGAAMTLADDAHRSCLCSHPTGTPPTALSAQPRSAGMNPSRAGPRPSRHHQSRPRFRHRRRWRLRGAQHQRGPGDHPHHLGSALLPRRRLLHLLPAPHRGDRHDDPRGLRPRGRRPGPAPVAGLDRLVPDAPPDRPRPRRPLPRRRQVTLCPHRPAPRPRPLRSPPTTARSDPLYPRRTVWVPLA